MSNTIKASNRSHTNPKPFRPKIGIMNGGLSIALLCASAVFGVQSLGLAQANDSSDESEMLLSDQPLVTTASKTAQRVSDVPSAVSVITAQQIKESGVTTVVDALRLSPGVDVIELNSGRVDVSIRGFNQVFSNKLLVMIDGRSVYQDVYGTTFWDMIPIELSRIDRIEIVRGPGSALYGANAFNGVINIITKHPLDFGLGAAGVSADVRRGDRNGIFAEVNKRIPVGSTGALIASGGYFNTDGLGFRNLSTGTHDRVRTPVGTLDYENQLKNGTLRLTGNINQGVSDFVTPYFAAVDTHYTNGDVTADYKSTGDNPLEARLFRSKSIFTFDSVTALDSETTDLEVQKQLKKGANNDLIFGGNYRLFRGRSMLVSTNWHEQETFAAYVQDTLRVNSRTNLFTGVRVGDNSQYGTTISPRISLVTHATHKTTFRLSYGNSYQAPTIIDSFLKLNFAVAPGLSVAVSGNPNLKPVRMDSLEAGVRTEIKSGYVALNLFDNRITNNLIFTPTALIPGTVIPSQLLRVNGPVAYAVGSELEYQTDLSEKLSFFANASYQDVHDGSGEVDFSPKWKGNFGFMSSPRSRTNLSLTERFVGPSIYHLNYGFSQVMTTPHLTTDLSIGLPVNKSESAPMLSMTVTDLFDFRYYEVPPAPNATVLASSSELRRTFWFGVSGTF